MNITKADFAQAITQNMGLNQRQAAELVDLFFAEIKTTLEQGEMVKLSGFGKFILRNKASRPGRNPKTKQAALISARRVVTFKPGEKFKTKVNQTQGS